jgi:hypothetical protein
MSDEGFLKRWSRRKRAETEPPAVEPESVEAPPSNLPPQAGEGSSSPPPRSEGGPDGASPQERGTSAKPDDDAVDPATLPPIESLGPDSDYTVFLKKGVPEALRIAALRRAWMSDTFIRDFRSPAIDYGWDFTTPDYSLRATDDVATMLDRVFPPQPAIASETEPDAKPADPPAPAPLAEGKPPPFPALSLPQNQATLPQPQPPPEPAPSTAPLPRRKHGGALPDKAD